MLTGMWGCSKRELPANQIGEVQFMFDGTIGAEPVVYQAGVNGLYMYSGFFKDSQGLWTLKTQFAQQGCVNCDSFLSFELKDVAVSNDSTLSGTVFDIFGSTGGVFDSYSLDSIEQTLQTETFFFSADFTPGNHYWYFDDGSIDSGTYVTKNFQTLGMKNVRHVVEYLGNTDSLSNSFNADLQSLCRPHFSISTDTLTHQVVVQSLAGGFSSFSWDFGNGTFTNTQTSGAAYNLPGLYTVTLTASSPSCSLMTYKQKANFTGNPYYPVANFGYGANLNTITSFVPRLNTSAFIISLKREGKVYHSYKKLKDIDQSGNPVFTAEVVEGYIKNEKGNNTVKVKGRIDTWLYNEINPNDSIKITSNKLTIAAAYP